MELSIVGGFLFFSFFFFAHHLVELGSFLASETIKEFQPAADAERKRGKERATERERGRRSAWWYKDSNHLQLHNTQSLHRELSLALIYGRSRAHMSVGPTIRDFPPFHFDWWAETLAIRRCNHRHFCHT